MPLESTFWENRSQAFKPANVAKKTRSDDRIADALYSSGPRTARSYFLGSGALFLAVLDFAIKYLCKSLYSRALSEYRNAVSAIGSMGWFVEEADAEELAELTDAITTRVIASSVF